MSSTTDQKTATRSLLVRCLEAVIRIEYPTENERAFRIAIMKRLGGELGIVETNAKAADQDKAALQERSALVRTLEAACKVDRPSEDELAFRLLAMERVGRVFELKAMRKVKLEAPAT